MTNVEQFPVLAQVRELLARAEEHRGDDAIEELRAIYEFLRGHPVTGELR